MFHDKGRLPLRRTDFDTEFTTNIAALCLRALSYEQTADASDQLAHELDRVIKNARPASDADDQVLALSHDLQRSLDEGHADPDLLRCLAQTVATKLQSRPVPSPDLCDLALTDALTGLGNRHAFDLMVAELKERHIPAGLILTDLDGLKRINTIAGFSAGDRALMTVANSLRQTLRQNDCIARIGGDEFAALLPRVSCLDVLTKIATRVSCATYTRISYRNIETPVSATIGFATIKSPGKDDAWQDAFDRADALLRQKKFIGDREACCKGHCQLAGSACAK